MANPEEHNFVRFNLRQRVEHLLIMLLFLLLALSGFPQKFFDSGWAQWLIPHLGGIDRLRWLHRVSGILFTLVAAAHLAVVVSLVVRQRMEVNMVPIKKDFRDAICMLRYYLGVSDEYPAFDRYDYRQKFEYWGLVLGGMVMMATGFVLYAPILFTRWLPGEIIPAAKVAHGSEGLLAFLVVILWHVYNAHLNPDVFPFDPSIFTGRISLERMRKEHALEYARTIASVETAPEETETAASPAERMHEDEAP